MFLKQTPFRIGALVAAGVLGAGMTGKAGHAGIDARPGVRCAFAWAVQSVLVRGKGFVLKV